MRGGSLFPQFFPVQDEQEGKRQQVQFIQLYRRVKIQMQDGRQAPQHPTAITVPPRDIPEQAKRKMFIRSMVIDIPDEYRKDQ